MLKKILAILLLFTIYLAGKASAADQVFFFHSDPVGTPLAMTDSSGAVVWRGDYKPFGEESSVIGAAANDRRFVGKEKDEETGLYYFGARYMNDKIGRFLLSDSVGPVNPITNNTNDEMLLIPQKLNKYAYALNNPYRYADPDGKEPVTITAILANLFLSSTANAPEYRYSPTAHSQSVPEFAGEVVLFQMGGRIAGDTLGAFFGRTGAPVARSLGAAALKTYFPEARVLAKIFGVTEREFHQVIKKEILKDVGKLPKWLGSNPNIGVTETGNIVLQSVKTKKELITDLIVQGYKR